MSSILTKKFLGSFPNTYTLTKLLAEQIINEERNNIPVVIFRPSIVISSLNDPVKGWIDNFNGPIGLMMACGKGIVRITYGEKSIIPDYMAVDVSIKSMIVAAWHKSKSNSLGEDNLVPVYNSASVSKSVSNEELLHLGMKTIEQYPFDEMLWRPTIKFTTCFYYFYLSTLIEQVFPAIFFDALLDLIGKPHKRLLPLQQKIYVVTMALSYFTTKTWKFDNSNFLGLIDKIPDVDRKEFDYDFKDVDITDFIRNAAIGSQKYLFNVDETKLPYAKKLYNRFVWMDRLLKTFGAILMVFILFHFNIIPNAFLHDIFCYF
uniref:Fatty acyl-CoA reductase n=2 Tax=Melanaphis sacchari TaxID=742174 RepID=A0A2H8TGL7_9HEMI